MARRELELIFPLHRGELFFEPRDAGGESRSFPRHLFGSPPFLNR